MGSYLKDSQMKGTELWWPSWKS